MLSLSSSSPQNPSIMTEIVDDIAHVMQFAEGLTSNLPVHKLSLCNDEVVEPVSNGPGPQHIQIPSLESEDSEHEVELECLDGVSPGVIFTFESDSSSSESDVETSSVISMSETSVYGVKTGNGHESGPEEDDGEGPVVLHKGDPTLAFRSANETQPIVKRSQVTKIDDMAEVQRIGEIQSVVGTAVIIQSSMGGQFRVLDTDSLLVFEDRTVLGFIFEAFGPIRTPMYVVRFNSVSEIDTESIRPKREVFHVSDHSTFLYTKQLYAAKGSDASNYWDEEVMDAQDFSDDEQEALHRRKNKKNRQARRESSGPSQRKQDPSWVHFDSRTEDPDVFYGDPYDDMTAPPSFPSSHLPDHRPMPSPYSVDSPYDEQPVTSIRSSNAPLKGNRVDKRAQRRGKGRATGRSDRRLNSQSDNASSSHTTIGASTMEDYDPRDPATGRPMSPMSLAIAKATGQWDSLPVASAMSQFSPRPFFNPNHPIMHQMGYGPGNANSWNAFGNMGADAQKVSQLPFHPPFVPQFAEGSTPQITDLQRHGYQLVDAYGSNDTEVTQVHQREEQ